MVWGDFCLFVFLFGGSVFFVFCFLFFWAKKKLALVSVLLLVRTLNIEVFLKIKEEEK